MQFSIASYAVLTNIIAQQTGLEVGEFIRTFGGTHTYSDHVDLVTELVESEYSPVSTVRRQLLAR